MSDSPVFVRRSAHNLALSTDGISHADEDSILKAMNRASCCNLDGDVRGSKPVVHALPMGRALTPPVDQIRSGMDNASTVVNINSLSNLYCSNKLKR
jgi:hypothetical protein